MTKAGQAAAALTRRRREIRSMGQIGTFTWFAIDFFVAFSSICVAFVATPYNETLALGTETLSAEVIGYAVLGGLATALVAKILGLHELTITLRSSSLLYKCAFVSSAAVLLISVFSLFVLFETLGRYILIIGFVLITLGLMAARTVQRLFVSRNKERICFVGSDLFKRRATQLVKQNSWLSYHFEPRSVRTLPTFFHDDVTRSGISEIVVHPDEVSSISSDDLLDYSQHGIKVTSYSDFVELNKQSIPVDDINSNWIINAQLDRAHPYYNSFKRLLDLIVSSVGLLVSAPVVLLLFIVVRLESKGSPLYSQERIGQFGVPFNIYKIRTMANDAESKGAQWAKVNDSRVTRVGAILRKTRLDEIPQLWNVFKGEMSLIGPRPERQVFIEMLEQQIPFYNQRHLVKPGITGWAQISYPYGASVDDAREKLSYDLYYIKNLSWTLDFHILLRTIGTLAAGSR